MDENDFIEPFGQRQANQDPEAGPNQDSDADVDDDLLDNDDLIEPHGQRQLNQDHVADPN